jgi:RND family efflux transporter MFP subunit
VSSNKFNGQVRISSVPQALGDCGLYISVDMTKSYANGEWKVSLPSKVSASYATNLNNYNNALLAREQAIINAQTAITNAELTLNQKVAGARAEDIASAKASLASANLNYENTIVRAPFDGQIGSVSASVGQQTNSQQGVATIITKDKIAEISLNEIDIVNVKLGQPVELTFDAIPGEVFMGSIAQIDTVGINTSNVVSFATKISIPNADERIKSGMSVTANIITEKVEGVLSVPSATIKSEGKRENKKTYVLKKEMFGDTATSTKVFVTVGLDNDVDAEIVEGLTEGDEVLSKTVGGTAAKTQATFSLFGGGGARPAGATTRTTGGTAR